MFKIVKHKVADAIYLLRFKTQYELASTFLRIQEHYESPRFSNRVFTLEQYMDWYAAEYGAFTYFEDWSGFNVPSSALEPFYDGRFDPLLEKEKRLLHEFRTLKGRFYVIGVYTEQDLTHELAHALYFTDDVYREDVRKVMHGFDTSALRTQLATSGYARHVVADEVQAYIVAPSGKVGARSRALAPLRRRLRALFREHSARLKIPRLS
jgi:hypothetical protein